MIEPTHWIEYLRGAKFRPDQTIINPFDPEDKKPVIHAKIEQGLLREWFDRSPMQKHFENEEMYRNGFLGEV